MRTTACAFPASVATFFVVAGLCQSANSADAWTPPQILAKVRVSTTGEPLCVPVRVDGKDRRFIVDTGAGTTVVDSALLAPSTNTGDSQISQTPNGTVTLPVHSAPKLVVAGIEAKWITRVVACDLQEINRLQNLEAHGIIGTDFLCRMTVHMDLDNGILLFCDGSREAYPDGIKLPLKWQGELYPTIPVEFKGLGHTSFALDTGYEGTGSIRPEVRDAMRKLGIAQTTGVASWSYDLQGRGVEVSRVRCTELCLGEMRNRNLVLQVEEINILGLYFLCRYRTTLDFRRNVAVFTPGDRLQLADRQDGHGLQLRCNAERQYWVERVEQESAAHAAGIKVRDQILAVNDRPIERISDRYLERLFTFPTKEDIRLQIKRGNSRVSFTLPGG